MTYLKFIIEKARLKKELRIIKTRIEEIKCCENCDFSTKSGKPNGVICSKCLKSNNKKYWRPLECVIPESDVLFHFSADIL